MGEKSFVLTKKCDHVAFIMDGNGRWAKAKGLPRHLGHKEACKRMREVFDTCMDYNIHVMSFYAFSTENWNRPQDEIDHLMKEHSYYVPEIIQIISSVDKLCGLKA
jgi:undecaprenyl diphosphate synthase